MSVLARPMSSDPAVVYRARTMSICDYVELPLDVVTERLSRPDLDAVLTDALSSALGQGGPAVEVHATGPETLGRAMTRVAVTWRLDGVTAEIGEGEGTITAVVVQSGRQAMTELLVRVPVFDQFAGQAAAVARRFLEALTVSLRRDA